MSPIVRKSLVSLHLWCGFTVGLVLVMLGLSGAAMIFRVQLEPIFSAKLFQVAPRGTVLSLDTLLAKAKAANPASTVNYVRIFKSAEKPVMVRFKDFNTVFVNPYTGEILGLQNRSAGFFGPLVTIHKLRFLGELGGHITASCALVFVFIILTGWLLWLPSSRRALVAGLTLNRSLSGRPWSLNLHKTVAIYASLIVLASALTGIMQAFDWAKDALYAVTGSAKEAAPKPAAAAAPGKSLPLDAFVPKLRALSPDFSEALLYPPHQGVVDGYVVGADASHPTARSMFWLNAVTGDTLRYIPYAQASLGFRAYWFGYSLHTGQIGGLAGQLFLLFGALSIPVIAVSGLISYLRRKSRVKPLPTPARSSQTV
jgi:uncharacterized iron-regulated membrane protein